MILAISNFRVEAAAKKKKRKKMEQRRSSKLNVAIIHPDLGIGNLICLLILSNSFLPIYQFRF